MFVKAHNVTKQWGLVDPLEGAIAALAISVLCFGIANGTIKWCAYLHYMSREMIAQAVRGQQFVLSLHQGFELFAMLALFVVPVLLSWWFCPGVFFTGLVIAWFISEILRRLRESGPSAEGVVIVYCLAPADLLGELLWSKQPPIIFQQLMGINLSAGGYESEANQGRWLFAESERLGCPPQSLFPGKFWCGSRGNGGLGGEYREKNFPGRFIVKRPLNWVDTHRLRAEEFVHSNLLPLEDVRPEGAGEAPAVSSRSEEVERFKQFAYSDRGGDKKGLELVSDGPGELLRVADARKFSEALYAWAN